MNISKNLSLITVYFKTKNNRDISAKKTDFPSFEIASIQDQALKFTSHFIVFIRHNCYFPYPLYTKCLLHCILQL